MFTLKKPQEQKNFTKNLEKFDQNNKFCQGKGKSEILIVKLRIVRAQKSNEKRILYLGAKVRSRLMIKGFWVRFFLMQF